MTIIIYYNYSHYNHLIIIIIIIPCCVSVKFSLGVSIEFYSIQFNKKKVKINTKTE